MQTGWRASAPHRRKSHTARLRRRPLRPSKKRRKSAKDSNAALRRKGLL